MHDPGSSPGISGDSGPSPEDDRLELQAILGQIHGLFQTTLDWLPKEDKELTASIRAAYLGMSGAVGEVHAALNFRRHDDGLKRYGLAGEQLEPKKRGFRWNLRGLVKSKGTGGRPYLIRALKWGNIILGSLSKELAKAVPGIEIVKEFGEVLLTAIEQHTES